MESKKINQLATELAPDLSDLTIIGDPTTGISKKITLSQMASLFTGTVEEYANLAAFPITGVADTIYIALDTNVIYRWDSTAYVVLSPNVIASLVFNDANGFDGTIALVGSVATLTITTALTSGSVPFIGASGALTQDNSNLFFDDTNNRLGIATASPTTPLDVFGSGIIGRLNATSTNNAYLGFASNGTNKWSAGNVQSDHRFRIFSEANSAELITILQTGEFGIGISNPTTKFHIDGAASALIANLDANVSIAKSVSYRSDNSARINLEVSGTESGSNVGADFFLRTFTDAGSLLETPFTIVRSTGVTTIKSLTLTNVLSVANGGTGSATQNFVDLTSVQTAAGAKTFSAITTISNATASTSTTTGALIVTGGVGIGGALFGTSATFTGNLIVSKASPLIAARATVGTAAEFQIQNSIGTGHWSMYSIIGGGDSQGNLGFYSLGKTGGAGAVLEITPAGAATFSSSVSTGGALNITVPYSASTMTILTQDNLGNGIYLGPRSNLNFDYGVAGNTNGVINNFGYQNGSAHFRSLGIGNGKGGTIAFFDGVNSRVGIGTSIPSQPLQLGLVSVITEDANSMYIGANFGNSTGGVYIKSQYANQIHFDSATGVLNFRVANTGTAGNAISFSTAMVIAYTGTVQINNLGTGTVTATSGVLSTVSDMNFKIEDGFIDNALEKVLNLKPRYFNWKEETGLPTNLRQLGFYAQEVNEALGEEAANTPKKENDKWGIYDRAIIAMLTKAMQEQQAQIEELKAEINLLKAK